MLKSWRIVPRERRLIVLLTLMTLLVFAPIVIHMVAYASASDYFQHVEFARGILERGEYPNAHVLYEGLMIALTAILPISLSAAAVIVAVLCYVVMVLILYALIRTAAPARGMLAAADVALALLLVTPITLLTLPQLNLYFGYIGVNILHNPTMVLLKPFALLLFVFTVGILNHTTHLTARTVLVGVLLVTLSMFAKPNDALVLLPALLVVIAYRLYRRDTADLNALVVALILPMIVLLALQYVLVFLQIDAGAGGIQFAPLLSISLYDQNFLFLPIKFVLSILFPAAVYLLYRPQTRRDTPLNLAWLMFLAGAGQMYLFAESGERLADGDFWWSAQIAVFILFVVSALFWLRHLNEQPRWRGKVCLGIFALHLISGVIFYIVQFRGASMFFGW